MPRGRQLIACQIRCRTIIEMATAMTDEKWKKMVPIGIDRVTMLRAAQQSLANGRPILVLPVDATAYRTACERLGIPADGRLRESGEEREE